MSLNPFPSGPADGRGLDSSRSASSGVKPIQTYSEYALASMVAMLQQSPPKLLAYLHTEMRGDDLASISAQVQQANLDGCRFLSLAMGRISTAGDGVRSVQANGWLIDALIVAPGVSAGEIAEWLQEVGPVLSRDAWIFGTHSWDSGILKSVQDATERAQMHLTFTSDVWLATPRVGLVPSFPSPVVGAIEAIRFGSIADAIDEVRDRASFKNCYEQGVSSFMRFGGGQTFSNPLPINVRQQSSQVQLRFKESFFPPYEETLVSEGHQIAYMRDLRVAGAKGYAYSRHGHLLDSAIGTGNASVKAIQEIIPAYEPIIRNTLTTVENTQLRGMAGIFPKAIDIDSPHVVVMWPDVFCYQHWLIGCLPRFWYLDEFPEFASMPIVMNALDRKFQLEYLHMLGVLDKTRLVHFHHTVSLRIKHAIYPSHFEAPMHSPGVIRWLRDRFLKHAAKLPAGCEGGLYYISRKDGRGRGIVNENEIIDYLTPRGFQIILWSQYSVAEQIALANHAKVIIGAHGSNMSNTVFVNPGCKVMSLCTIGVGHEGYDLNLAFGPQSIGAKSYFLVGQPLAGPISIADYRINFEEFKAVFSQMMDE